MNKMRNLPRNFIFLLGLFVPMIPLNIQEALAQRNLNFVLHNHTGYPIVEVYVSASNRDIWEEDVLGRGVLPPGQDVVINVPDSFGTCYFDIKVVFPDDSNLEKGGFNLCELSNITVP